MKEVRFAVIYTRVSTNEQVTNYSLDFQEEESSTPWISGDRLILLKFTLSF